MKFALLLIITLFVLLFVGGPGYHDERLIKEIWQTGHFILFATIVFTVMQIKFVKKQHWFHLLIGTGIFSSWFGVTTEALQLLVGRDFEFGDIANDIVGGYAGFLLARLFLIVQQKDASQKLASLFYTLGFIVLAAIGARAVIITLVDQQNIRSSFPILSDFESAFELKRWDNRSATISISDSCIRSGDGSMKVDFLADKYPDITLKDFARDWSNYKSIKFSLYNSEAAPIKMIFKVYDDNHLLNGYKYSDRFNQKITLKPGWNDFSFLLEQIKNTPKTRKMDLTSISSLSLFMVSLEKPLTIYLDDLYLSKK